MKFYLKLFALLAIFAALALVVDQFAAYRHLQNLLDRQSYQSPGMERAVMEARDRCWFLPKTLSTIRTDLERSATQPTTRDTGSGH